MVGYDRESRESFARDRGFDSHREFDRRDTRGYATDRRRDLEDLQRFEDEGGRTSGRELDRDFRGRRRDAEPIDPRGYGNAGGSEAGWSGYGNAGRWDSYRMEPGRDADRGHPGSHEFEPGSRYGRIDRESWNSREGDRAESWSYGSGSTGSPYRRDEGPGYGRRGSWFGEGSSYGAGVPGTYGTGFGSSYGNTGFGSGPNSSGGSSSLGSRESESHRGKGPKGYTRSDTRIEEDVNDCLTEDPNIDASTIEVAVKGGEVTLSGTVARREDKRRAEDAVERVSGVHHVQNNLRVRRGDAATGGSSGSQSMGSQSMSNATDRRSGIGAESSSRTSGGSSKST